MINPDVKPVAETSLSQHAITGTAWSTASTVGRQLLSIASVATVARMLGPRAYGVMGMANLLLVLIVNFRDLGTGTAIVQRLSTTQRLLTSLFWLNVGIGLTMALLVVATSGLTARFFHTPELVPILCTISVSFWLSSCGIVHNSLLLRQMRFKALAVVDLGSALVSYLVALSCAYAGLGVWSLVFANVANSAASTCMYWISSSWRPSGNFDATEVKSVMNFSLNLSGFGLVNYASRNADNIIVGRVLGQMALGNYQMAYNLMLTPLQSVSSVIAQVTLPGFSQIQRDDERFRSAFIRSSMMVGLLTFPMMAGLAVVANPLVRAILGAKWLAAIPIFQILAPVGLVQSVQTLIGSIFVAKGRTDWMFRWGVCSCIVVVAGFLIGVRFGSVGVAGAYCIVYFVLLVYPGFAIPFRLIGLRFQDFVAALVPQLGWTLAMAAVCWIWLHFLIFVSISNAWFQLISTSLLGAAFYTLALLLARPQVVLYVEELVAASRSKSFIKGWDGMQRLFRRGTVDGQS